MPDSHSSMTTRMGPENVSAVICTKNSITGIEGCLESLRAAGVGEIIVADAHSTDGTREVANAIADLVLEDPGTGLGNARNIGIAHTTQPLILNMGSDNVMPPGQLQVMIDSLESNEYQGVSAQTLIEGSDYVSRGLNAWRRGRFIPGPAAVIGTPTLFVGELLRNNPYDPTRIFSDDSELCERWIRDFGAKFAISKAVVNEVGKTSWEEVRVRCRMYGISDEEIFTIGRSHSWSRSRQLSSILHPIRSDLLQPLRNLSIAEATSNTPFLLYFTALRYSAWARSALHRRQAERRLPAD